VFHGCLERSKCDAPGSEYGATFDTDQGRGLTQLWQGVAVRLGSARIDALPVLSRGSVLSFPGVGADSQPIGGLVEGATRSGVRIALLF
jgi:hypothetical protein